MLAAIKSSVEAANGQCYNATKTVMQVAEKIIGAPTKPAHPPAMR